MTPKKSVIRNETKWFKYFFATNKSCIKQQAFVSPDYALQSDFSLSILSAMWLLKAVP